MNRTNVNAKVIEYRKRHRVPVLVLFALLAVTFAIAVCDGDSSDADSGNEGNIHWDYDKSTSTLTLSLKDSAGQAVIKDYEKDKSPWSDHSAKSLVIEEGIVVIGKYAFYDQDFRNVTIPESVKEIGNGAFEWCEFIEGHVKLPAGLSKLGKYAFKLCKNISELTIPISIDMVVDDDDDNEVFCDCGKIAKMHFLKGTNGKGVDYNADEYDNLPTYFSRKVLKEVTFEEGIVYIGDRTLKEVTQLKSVDFPSTLTSIGRAAFEKSGLSGHLVLPEGVTKIGRVAFKNCTNITEVTIPISVDTVVDEDSDLEVFYGVENVKAIHFLRGSGLGVNYSEDWRNNTLTYWSRNALTEVTFEEGIRQIGSWTLYDTAKVASISLPSTIKTIQNGAFDGCKGISNPLVIPDEISSIGKYAFRDCKSLTELVIPISLDSVIDSKSGNAVFSGVTNLTKVTFTPGSGFGFDYNDGKRGLTPWNMSRNTLTDVVFTEGIKRIGNNLLWNCSNIRGVYLPSSLETIGDSAFENLEKITELSLPNNVRSLGQFAFRNCEQIKKLHIGEGLTEIKAGDFMECPNINYIHFGSSIRLLSSDAFLGYDFFDSDGTTSLPPTADNMRGYNYEGTPGKMIRLYAVRFDPQGGSSPTQVAYSNTSGKLDSMPEAVRNGYTLLGWFDSIRGGERYTEDTLIKSSVTLYAHWDYVKPRTVTLTPPVVELPLGLSFTFIVNIVPYSAANVTWSSSDYRIAMVSNGVLYPVDAGTVTITATVNGVSGTATVTVKNLQPLIISFDGNGGVPSEDTGFTDSKGHLQKLPSATREGYTFNGWWTAPNGGSQVTTEYTFKKDTTVYAHWNTIPVDRVIISKNSVNLYAGSQLTLEAHVEPAEATEQKLIWKSSDPDIVTVIDGLLTAVAVGEVTITVESAEDASKYATCIVTVVNPTGVSHEVIFDPAGGTVTPESLMTDADGHLPFIPVPTKESYRFVGWFDEYDVEITVNTLFDQDQAVIAKWAVIPVEELNLSVYLLFLSKGETYQMGCEIIPADATSQQVSWISENPAIANIDLETGLITARSNGTTEIFAYAGYCQRSCIVTVTDPSDPIVATLDESGPMATVTNYDDILSAIKFAREQDYLPLVWASSEVCSGIQIPNMILRYLAVPSGNISVETPQGGIEINARYLYGILMIEKDPFEFTIKESATDSNMNVVCSVMFQMDSQYQKKIPHLYQPAEFSIKYDLTDSLDKYALYRFDEGQEPVRIDIKDYSDGRIYFDTDIVSTYGIVYEGQAPAQDGLDMNFVIMGVAAAALAAVAAVVVIVRKKKKKKADAEGAK